MADERFTPWTPETVAGRYYGLRQVGEDPYNYETLALTIHSLKSASLEWGLQGKDGDRGRKTLELRDVHADKGGFTATVVGKRPVLVPEKLSGRFVTKWSKGKGPVEHGLLLEGDWFLEI